MPAIVDEAALLADLKELIQSARQRIATVANSTTTLLYWHLGRRLLAESLQDERAQYGKRILATVSRELTLEFGQAFTLRSLYRAIQFCQGFTNQEIVSTLSTQLSWSHFIELLPIKDPRAREFYAEMCRIERWDVRTLRLKIGGMLFQRTALSRKPDAVISTEIAKLRDGQMTPDTVFRDPYLLDLLGLKGAYSERDLESAILREIEGVLLELGTGFPPLPAQARITELLDQEHAVAQSLAQAIRFINEYRTRLVADVVTGKLDVREAAARLPDEAPADIAEDDTDLNVDTEAADEEAAV